MIRLIPTATAALAALLLLSTTHAGVISVPGASFESPVVDFALPTIDSWQETPKPVWYDDSQGYPWYQLAGAFKNTAPGDPANIDNCDGNQAVYLFGVPQVGIFQDHDSTDWTGAAPSHAFAAKFQAGKSYHLTVGAFAGYPTLPGATLEFSLYYRDAASNKATVARTSVTNSPAVFSGAQHFVDFHVDVPAVNASDPWSGNYIGIQLISTVDPALSGGYWDIDNVRLTEIQEPVLQASAKDGQLALSIQSEPGLVLEILAAAQVSASAAQWTSLGSVTNLTGTVSFIDPDKSSGERFYRTRRLP